ncbi:AMP-binding protein [Cribrihabitans sp. XS_ASV171]
MSGQAAFSHHPQFRLLTPDPRGVGTLIEGVDREATILTGVAQEPPVRFRSEDRQWLLCQSSGSEAAPKTVRRSPASWVASFDISADRFLISAADIYATLGSLGHSLTLYATLEALHLGAGLCALGQSGPRSQVRAMNEFGVTVLYATPVQLRLLLRAARAVGIENIGLRRILVGGGKLDPDLHREVQRMAPAAEIREFFGASETSFITLSDKETPQGSVGRAYPGVEIAVDAAPDQTGEIWVRSPYLFDGYAEGESKDTRWRDGFLSIGEMGWLDARGNLFLRGRKSRMVTVADQNVFPEEIEAVISAACHGRICVVLAVPDPVRGNALHCLVERSTLPVRELRRLVRLRLGPASVPRVIRTVPELPLLPAGKPDLRAIRDLLERAG